MKRSAEGALEKEPLEQVRVEAIQADVEAARAALDVGDDERALVLLQRAVAAKHELWQQLLPRIESLAHRYAGYLQQATSLGKDDLVQEGYFKFLRVIRRWDRSRGFSIPGWILFTLGRHFVQLARSGRSPRSLAELQRLARCRPSRPDQALLQVEIEDVIASLLPEATRRQEKLRAFRSYWLEGWSMTEVARQESVSVSTMHKWLLEVGRSFAQAYAGQDGV